MLTCCFSSSFLLFATVVLAFTLQGCAYITEEAWGLPDAQKAVLDVPASVSVDKINGKSTGGLFRFGKVELAPGTYHLELTYSQWPMPSGFFVSISFEARPGRSYVFDVTRRSSFIPPSPPWIRIIDKEEYEAEGRSK